MVALFALADKEVSREQISQWLKKEDDPDFVACNDETLATFLNGLITDKRGKKDGPIPKPEKRLTNNAILTKLKIALSLQSDDIINMLSAVGFRLTKPELSAFSRKPDHKHYKVCKDQILRNFIQAIDEKFHVARTKKVVKPSALENDFDNSNNKPLTQGKIKARSFNKKSKEPYVEGARPNASKVYVNPNRNEQEPSKADVKRKVLKLTAEQIWGSDKKK
tara:strand:- start:762 stop:1424 length:663 start_codon:yes stop_codon:yes gene_type:complete